MAYQFLLSSFAIMVPLDQMFLKSRPMLLVICGSGATYSLLKCLAVYRWCWICNEMWQLCLWRYWWVFVGFGVKLCHQAVSVMFDFSVEDCDILPGPLGGELEWWIEWVYSVRQEDHQGFLAAWPDRKNVVCGPFSIIFYKRSFLNLPIRYQRNCLLSAYMY